MEIIWARPSYFRDKFRDKLGKRGNDEVETMQVRFRHPIDRLRDGLRKINIK